ncbi:MAG: HD domain-containing protein [Thaumarchaeota archaeon]|nr:HD domain-containing protein [Nitrososphaerota archaeon]
MEARAAEIRDPVHGYIYATDVEKDVIDSHVFQRMRRIRQLSGAHLTYPGAQHTRFEHMTGTMHLAGLTAQSLLSKGELKDDDVQQLRLAALLHDVGHGPFSHLFEEVMTEKNGLTHEDMTTKIVKESEVGDILQKYGFDKETMSSFAIGFSPKKPQFMNEVIGGGLSVDIMDYLLRDSYFTGVEYGKVDIHRVLNSLEVVEKRLALNHAALYAFEALMIARYEMFKAVYFHRTVRAAEVMLIKALSLADSHMGLTDVSDLNKYLSMTDEVVLNKLTELKTQGSSDLKRAKQLAEDVRDRRLFKCVFERVLHRRDQDRFMARIFAQKRVRDGLADEIAGKADTDPDLIYIDVPTAPSVPITSTRQALTSLTLVSRTKEGLVPETVKVEDLPLVGAISGYMDILRIYTTASLREKVEDAVKEFFGKEGYAGKVSM